MRIALDARSDLIEASIDEVGLGAYMGPVTVAVVIWPKSFKQIGLCKEYYMINDSKKLTEKKRYSLLDYIKAVSIDYSIVDIDSSLIDKFGVLKARDKAIHLAINKLVVKPGLLLIDGDKFRDQSGIPYKLIVKGDSLYMGIAAASILAKCHRDTLVGKLHKEFPMYNWIKNKGYGTADHTKALKEHGITDYHRKSYKPIMQLTKF